MSHWTTIKTQIRDAGALTAAARELGLTIIPNALARGWAGATKESAYVIKLPGEFDIAVNRAADGTFALDADFYDGSVAKIAGEGFKRLIQLYGVHKATIEARRKGLSVTRQTMSNGSIKLAIQGAL